jgi:hypothetical protein
MRARGRALLLAFAVSCSLYTIGWFLAAARFERAIDEALLEARARNVTIYGEPQPARGFPFLLAVRFERWGATAPSGLRWFGEALELRLRPWAPLTLRAALLGEHRLFAVLRENRTLSARVEGGEVTVPMDAVTLGLRAATIEVAENEGAALPFAAIDLRLRIEPGIPHTPDRAALLAWSESGGRLILDHAEGRFETASFAAQGWLGIDPLLRPTGRTDWTLTAYAPLLRAFAARGWIESENLTMIEVALAWLSTPDGESGAPVLRLPLSAENGVLSFGPVRVAALEPLL